jgi:hypothetical protein
MREFLDNIRTKLLTGMHRVAVEVDDGILIFIEIWIRLDDLMAIRLKDTLDPLYIVVSTSTDVIAIVKYFFHCLECTKMAPFFITLRECKVESICTRFGHAMRIC